MRKLLILLFALMTLGALPISSATAAPVKDHIDVRADVSATKTDRSKLAKPTGVGVPVLSVYVESSNLNGDARYALRQWNRLHNVELVRVTTPCSGVTCIIVTSVDRHPEGTCGNLMGGCEYSTADGTIHVTITNNLDDINRNLESSILIHELGHALGLNHRDPAQDPKTVMSSFVSASDPIMRPSAQDYALVEEMWADGYQAPAA